MTTKERHKVFVEELRGNVKRFLEKEKRDKYVYEDDEAFDYGMTDNPESAPEGQCTRKPQD